MTGAMSDNPFAEPADDDATIVRPLPGAQQQSARPATTRLARAPGRGPAPIEGPGFVDPQAFAVSPILAAAAPLLSLLARLGNVLSVPDPAGLRDRTAGELRRFEQRLREQKVALELIRPSHYALCASLDDVVRSTPWGSRGPWADTSLVSTFHGEVRSGERFFEVLAQMRREPGKFLPVIELMYVCMALGMQGRYRLSPQGPAELDRVREETYAIIARHSRPMEQGLSPHWQGVSAPYRPLRPSLPVWVAAMGGAGLLALLYALLAFSLNDASDRLFASALALPPGHVASFARPALPVAAPAEPAPPPPPGERAKLVGLLQPEINEGLAAVAGTEAVPIVRLIAPDLFASGSATLNPRHIPLLQRIAADLRDEAGKLDVVGYTDDQPIRTIRFPSNYQLSEARAQATASVLATSIDPQRISTEGRADADPIAPNATPAGRQQNRRIEIVLHRSEAAR